ncbi:ATP-binding protein [Pelotomaculum propionicicum]|uniref:Circadian input-output histidine kinase CikA n=1 Tax=Pelotomaculum propionicicum TaxID=258475 RepID=A0A4Y7RWY5_9FIRM|nr:ATP-binding protein [Pelotomaculum propionicicum]TEB13494.1 Aerobic respiration control sensor protein ArcB [Pelotomaculum propionicicum]
MIKVGIIGAGHGGTSILNVLATLKEAEVIGICDINPEAAGLSLARQLNTPVFSHYRDLLNRPGLELIFEVTGSSAVREAVHLDCPIGVDVVDAQVAKLMMDLFEELLETNKKLQNEINERKKVEEALLESNEKLKEIDKLKTDFLSTVSHELRTPLTSVIGFARLTRKKLEDVIFPQVKSNDKKVETAEAQIRSNINIIVSEGERLTELINDVLDIAKLEAGKVEWKMEPLSISEIIDRATASTAFLFEQKGIKLIKDIPADLPNIKGDRDRLIQVLINLISNAVKFTDKGSVTCRVRDTGRDLFVSVIDTGSGISNEDKEKVFEKFKQSGDTLTGKPKGTGLGLAICRQIVSYHGGRIWAESELGQGSVFTFTIPVDKRINVRMIDKDTLIKQFREQVVNVAPAPSRGKKIILVVDDDINIRALLRQELEAVGYCVREAGNGLEAIKEVKVEKPDLIILDVMMPNMSGFDVAAVLRNDPNTMEIPIVILSIVEDMDRGYRIGIDRYYTKPVNTENLLEGIGALVSRGASRKKVIVVDKDESTVKTLTGALEAKGYTVEVVNDLEGCIRRAREEKPDMIIVDASSAACFDIVKTLRFEKELENSFLLLLGKQEQDVIEI